MIDTVLFDLDGSLLPMDQDVFTKAYFKELCRRVAPLGYEAEKLIASVWKGTAAMVRNDGSRTNEAAFWESFAEDFGEKGLADKPVFDEFYATDFNKAAAVCGRDPLAAETVARLKAAGRRVILASNPIFPRVAQESRMRWAGLDPADFDYITSYENSSYCKPNPAYFREIAEKLGLDPARCLMVGNDTGEDTPAAACGMRLFLLTPCMIDRAGTGPDAWPHGEFAELLGMLEEEGTVDKDKR